MPYSPPSTAPPDSISGVSLQGRTPYRGRRMPPAILAQRERRARAHSEQLKQLWTSNGQSAQFIIQKTCNDHRCCRVFDRIGRDIDEFFVNDGATVRLVVQSEKDRLAGVKLETRVFHGRQAPDPVVLPCPDLSKRRRPADYACPLPEPALEPPPNDSPIQYGSLSRSVDQVSPMGKIPHIVLESVTTHAQDNLAGDPSFRHALSGSSEQAASMGEIPSIVLEPATPAHAHKWPTGDTPYQHGAPLGPSDHLVPVGQIRHNTRETATTTRAQDGTGLAASDPSYLGVQPMEYFIGGAARVSIDHSTRSPTVDDSSLHSSIYNTDGSILHTRTDHPIAPAPIDDPTCVRPASSQPPPIDYSTRPRAVPPPPIEYSTHSRSTPSKPPPIDYSTRPRPALSQPPPIDYSTRPRPVLPDAQATESSGSKTLASDTHQIPNGSLQVPAPGTSASHLHTLLNVLSPARTDPGQSSKAPDDASILSEQRFKRLEGRVRFLDGGMNVLQATNGQTAQRLRELETATRNVNEMTLAIIIKEVRKLKQQLGELNNNRAPVEPGFSAGARAVIANRTHPSTPRQQQGQDRPQARESPAHRRGDNVEAMVEQSIQRRHGQQFSQAGLHHNDLSHRPAPIEPGHEPYTENFVSQRSPPDIEHQHAGQTGGPAQERLDHRPVSVEPNSTPVAETPSAERSTPVAKDHQASLAKHQAREPLDHQPASIAPVSQTAAENITVRQSKPAPVTPTTHRAGRPRGISVMALNESGSMVEARLDDDMVPQNKPCCATPISSATIVLGPSHLDAPSISVMTANEPNSTLEARIDNDSAPGKQPSTSEHSTSPVNSSAVAVGPPQAEVAGIALNAAQRPDQPSIESTKPQTPQPVEPAAAEAEPLGSASPARAVDTGPAPVVGSKEWALSKLPQSAASGISGLSTSQSKPARPEAEKTSRDTQHTVTTAKATLVKRPNQPTRSKTVTVPPTKVNSKRASKVQTASQTPNATTPVKPTLSVTSIKANKAQDEKRDKLGTGQTVDEPSTVETPALDRSEQDKRGTPNTQELRTPVTVMKGKVLDRMAKDHPLSHDTPSRPPREVQAEDSVIHLARKAELKADVPVKVIPQDLRKIAMAKNQFGVLDSSDRPSEARGALSNDNDAITAKPESEADTTAGAANEPVQDPKDKSSAVSKPPQEAVDEFGPVKVAGQKSGKGKKSKASLKTLPAQDNSVVPTAATNGPSATLSSAPSPPIDVTVEDLNENFEIKATVWHRQDITYHEILVPSTETKFEAVKATTLPIDLTVEDLDESFDISKSIWQREDLTYDDILVTSTETQVDSSPPIDITIEETNEQLDVSDTIWFRKDFTYQDVFLASTDTKMEPTPAKDAAPVQVIEVPDSEPLPTYCPPPGAPRVGRMEKPATSLSHNVFVESPGIRSSTIEHSGKSLAPALGQSQLAASPTAGHVAIAPRNAESPVTLNASTSQQSHASGSISIRTTQNEEDEQTTMPNQKLPPRSPPKTSKEKKREQYRLKQKNKKKKDQSAQEADDPDGDVAYARSHLENTTASIGFIADDDLETREIMSRRAIELLEVSGSDDRLCRGLRKLIREFSPSTDAKATAPATPRSATMAGEHYAPMTPSEVELRTNYATSIIVPIFVDANRYKPGAEVTLGATALRVIQDLRQSGVGDGDVYEMILDWQEALQSQEEAPTVPGSGSPDEPVFSSMLEAQLYAGRYEMPEPKMSDMKMYSWLQGLRVDVSRLGISHRKIIPLEIACASIANYFMEPETRRHVAELARWVNKKSRVLNQRAVVNQSNRSVPMARVGQADVLKRLAVVAEQYARKPDQPSAEPPSYSEISTCTSPRKVDQAPSEALDLRCMGNDANNFIDTALGPGKRHRAKSSSMDEPTVTETAERIGTTRAVEPSPSRAGPTAQSPVNPTLGGSDRSPIQGLLWSPAAQIEARLLERDIAKGHRSFEKALAVLLIQAKATKVLPEDADMHAMARHIIAHTPRSSPGERALCSSASKWLSANPQSLAERPATLEFERSPTMPRDDGLIDLGLPAQLDFAPARTGTPAPGRSPTMLQRGGVIGPGLPAQSDPAPARPGTPVPGRSPTVPQRGGAMGLGLLAQFDLVPKTLPASPDLFAHIRKGEERISPKSPSGPTSELSKQDKADLFEKLSSLRDPVTSSETAGRGSSPTSHTTDSPPTLESSTVPARDVSPIAGRLTRPLPRRTPPLWLPRRHHDKWRRPSTSNSWREEAEDEYGPCCDPSRTGHDSDDESNSDV